jgi:hypothetical protein
MRDDQKMSISPEIVVMQLKYVSEEPILHVVAFGEKF